MADATIKAWRCDLCGKVVRERDAGYDCHYEFSIKCTSGDDIHGLETHYPQICVNCTECMIDIASDIYDKRL